MAKRTNMVNLMKEFFDRKGRILSAKEYTKEDNVPIRIQQIRKTFGSWNLMTKYVIASQNGPRTGVVMPQLTGRSTQEQNSSGTAIDGET